jgi:hypothetical protein
VDKDIGATVLKVDDSPITNEKLGDNIWGWKPANGDPGDLDYRAGSKFKFTDRDQTVYELVTIAGSGNVDWTIRRADAPHTGGLVDRRGNAEESSIDTVADSSSSLNNKYFTLEDSDAVKYHIWLDVNSAGTDPAPTGSTGMEVDIAVDATANAVAAAIKAVIHAHAKFTCAVTTNALTVVDVQTGAVVDVGAGNSGFTVSVDDHGATMSLLIRGESTSSLGNSTGGGGNRQRLRNLGYI